MLNIVDFYFLVRTLEEICKIYVKNLSCKHSETKRKKG